MGFFNLAEPAPESRAGRPSKVSFATLHAAECKACPLNQLTGLKHPHMEPVGSKNPLVYMLGEAPGEEEDKRGEPFVGRSGRVLRSRIPSTMASKLRWSNCVRTRPPKNRTPTDIEIECCRPSVVRDIERTKPKAIFGFGNVPLYWAGVANSGILSWAGRRVPIRVGKHTCWYFPMMHPSYVLRGLEDWRRKHTGYGSDNEFRFALDMKQAFASLQTLPEPVVHTPEMAVADVEFVTGAGEKDVRKVLDFLARLSSSPLVGFDYETNGIRPYKSGARILTVALSSQGETLAFPLFHSGSGWSDKERQVVWSAFKDWLYEYKGRKVAHNLAFEMEWSAHFFGKEVLRAGKWGDSLSQAYLLDERPKTHSLEFLGIQYFGINLKKISNLDRAHLDRAPLDQVLLYNGTDAKYHRLLYVAQRAELKAQKLMDVYNQHLPRIPTMVLTQLLGLPIDQKTVSRFDRTYSRRIESAAANLAKLSSIKRFKKKYGHDFNPSATHDVRKYFAELGIFPDKVDEKHLVKIKHAVARLILRWRKANKLHSTYVKPVMPGSPHVFPDGLLHPIISTCRTRTWRTSSEDPNIQNWPKRVTKEVRSQIKPPDGFKVVSFDYGQIQARNVAMESLDKVLVKAFWDKYDIHSDWVWRILDKYPSWVAGGRRAVKEDKDLFKKYRNRAKNELVFPSFFGARAKKVASELKVPIEVADQLCDDFAKMFPEIKDWHQRITDTYFKKGYVTGHTGFRRRAPISPNEIINAPIQADEVAIVCDAMTRLSKLGLQASMEIHDDLTFIWPEKKVDEYAEIVIREMLTCPFDWANVVPLVVEMSIGDNWADTKAAGEFSSDSWKGMKK